MKIKEIATKTAETLTDILERLEKEINPLATCSGAHIEYYSEKFDMIIKISTALNKILELIDKID